jgi:hypothetical protein
MVLGQLRVGLTSQRIAVLAPGEDHHVDSP